MIESSAKRFYEDEYGDERIRVHSEEVIEVCLNTIKGTLLDPGVFLIAGWLHDIGRKDGKEGHSVRSCELAKKFFRAQERFKEYEVLVLDCIRHHGSDGRPETLYGRVFQTADKVALQRSRWLVRERRG